MLLRVEVFFGWYSLRGLLVEYETLRPLDELGQVSRGCLVQSQIIRLVTILIGLQDYTIALVTGRT